MQTVQRPLDLKGNSDRGWTSTAQLARISTLYPRHAYGGNPCMIHPVAAFSVLDGQGFDHEYSIVLVEYFDWSSLD